MLISSGVKVKMERCSFLKKDFVFFCASTALILFTSFTVLFPTIYNPILLVSYDSLLHTSIGNSILHYGLPPKTLYLPEEPLNYHWFGDLLMLLFNQLIIKKKYLLQSWPYFSLCVAFLILYAAYNLSKRIGLGRFVSVVSSYFVMFGYGIYSGVAFLLKQAGQQSFPITNIDFLTKCALYHDFKITFAKFYVPAPFPAVLPLVLFYPILLMALIKHSHSARLSLDYTKTLISFLFGGTSLFLINFLCGVSVLVSSFIGVVVLILCGKINCHTNHERAFKILLPIVALGVINAALLKLLIGGGIIGRIHFPFSPGWKFNFQMIGNLIIPGTLPLLLFSSCLKLKNGCLKLPYPVLLLIIMGTGHGILNFVIFPDDNQYKFIFLFYFYLCIGSFYIFIKAYRKKNKKFIFWSLLISTFFIAINSFFFCFSYAKVRCHGMTSCGEYALTMNDFSCAQWIEKNTGESSVFAELTQVEYSIITSLANRRTYIKFINALKLHGYNKKLIESRFKNLLVINNHGDIEKARRLGIDYILCNNITRRHFLDHQEKIVYENPEYTIFRTH